MILLMGISGSGKGTQGALLAEKDGYRVISTGELLRNYGSDEQHARMQKGEFLGDSEVTDLLDQALSGIPDQNNVILDGYPRRITQADWLLDQQKKGRFVIDCVIHLTATHEEAKTRMLERARSDDTDEGIEQRFAEYDKDTSPILAHLDEAGVKVCEINALQSVDAVHVDIVNALKESVHSGANTN